MITCHLLSKLIQIELNSLKLKLNSVEIILYNDYLKLYLYYIYSLFNNHSKDLDSFLMFSRKIFYIFTNVFRTRVHINFEKKKKLKSLMLFSTVWKFEIF